MWKRFGASFLTFPMAKGLADQEACPMKGLLLALCGCVVVCACGGGGGGGGASSAVPALYVSISPSAQTSVDEGQSVQFTAAVENDSSGSGVTWKISGAGSTATTAGVLTNVTTTTATYNALSAVSASLSIVVTATSVADPSRSGSTVVIISPPLGIATTTLPNATPNANYSATLQATGGAGTLTWSLAAGVLPVGLSLSKSGVISGYPTVPGTSTFTVQVSDSSSSLVGENYAQAQLSLTVVTLVSISTLSLPSGSEGITYLAGFAATGGTPPYTWRLAGGSFPPGLTIQSNSGVISGSPTSEGTFTFTIEASDSSPTPQTQTQSMTITIGAPWPLSITTLALLNGTLGMPYNARLTALGGTPPYTWTITAGALPSNVSLSPSTGAISGTPSSTGTANFTVMVTDASSTPATQTQELSLTVASPPMACTSSGNNAVLSGPYAFRLSGFDSVGFLTVVGSFTADGTGKITAGEADTNGVLGAQQGNIIPSASAYTVGPDNRGCATLATPFGTFVTQFALGSLSSNIASSGRLIEWDSPSTSAYIAAGQLLRQTSSAFARGLSGNYVFRTVGWDPPTRGGRDACVGVFSASSNAFSSLEQDCNSTWAVASAAAPGTAGTYTNLDGNGRGTGIITVEATSSFITFYMVSSSQLLVVNADSGPYTSGEWDEQYVPAGSSVFTQASLNGNMVFYLNGGSANDNSTAVSMETASANANGTIVITFHEDRAGTTQIPGTYTCVYDVEQSGRVTLSSDTQSCGGNPPVLYLTSQNTGFILDGSPGVDTGFFEPQSAGPFNNASLAGTVFGGMDEVATQSALAEVDLATPNGAGTITGTTGMSSLCLQSLDSSFPASAYVVNSDGTFTLDSSGGSVAGIIISSSKFVLFSPTTAASPYPTLLIMQK
jgi:hypothetical protein